MVFKLAYLKAIIFTTSVLPLVRLCWLAVQDGLGANPVEAVIHSLGTWALVFLLLSLSMSPLRLALHAGWPLQLRRMLGLFAFFFATLHLLAYAGLDLWFDWNTILGDISKHPYVILGFTAFLLMLPLAATSNQRAMKRMGRRWVQLHRLVYPVAVLAVLHFLWLVKKDLTEPLIYASVLLLLLLFRSRPCKSFLQGNSLSIASSQNHKQAGGSGGMGEAL
ncbi:MAG: sulfoxide reductase heme-binding subunit YedZ [Methylobacterium sp.]|nr:sulfoxide reductase heme-binding subunit YedZ [Methylobacterium sp.]